MSGEFWPSCDCTQCLTRQLASKRTSLEYWTARDAKEGPDSAGCPCTDCRGTQWVIRHTRDRIQREADALAGRLLAGATVQITVVPS